MFSKRVRALIRLPARVRTYRPTPVLEPAGENATKVTITENGTTGPAMWRFVDHYVMHEDGQIRQYLGDLKRVAAQGN